MWNDDDSVIGERFYETEHLSVPQLARHLVHELPREFRGLWFSATVYRYRVAGPWIVDVEVFGVRDSEIDDHDAKTELLGQIEDRLGDYNWSTGTGDCRFAGPNVLLLREYEQGERQPCRVTVRRYFLSHKPRGLWAKARSLVTGWLR